MKPATRLVTLGREPSDGSGASGFVNPSVQRGSTVLHASVADMRERVRRTMSGDDSGPVTYGIHGTPTHRAFLDAMTALEGGHRSWVLPSGLSACTTAIQAFVQQGDHVLVPDSAYGPTRAFCSATLARWGIEASYYEPDCGARIESHFRANTRLLFLESPGSLTFEMQDIPAMAAAARRRGVITVADNTWATPLFFRPLEHGVDVSVHAVTKYIGGHADLLLGTITSNEACTPPLRALIRSLGLTASPDDCWVALRGLRTLEARLQRHRATAESLIDWLRQQPEVLQVLYPALAQDPGHAIWQRDFSGASGLFGVVLQAGYRVDGLSILDRWHAPFRPRLLVGRLREPADSLQPPTRSHATHAAGAADTYFRRHGRCRRSHRRPAGGLRPAARGLNRSCSVSRPCASSATTPFGALAGIKVVDLSRVLGGPYATMILADHGADVIKIEPPQGDDTRQWGPPFAERADGSRDASYFSASIATSGRWRSISARRPGAKWCCVCWPTPMCWSRISRPERWKSGAWAMRATWSRAFPG